MQPVVLESRLHHFVEGVELAVMCIDVSQRHDQLIGDDSRETEILHLVLQGPHRILNSGNDVQVHFRID